MKVLEDLELPDSCKGEVLDSYLQKGWFRSGNFIFTTHFLDRVDKRDYVAWIRYDLQRFVFSKAAKRIRQKNKHYRHVFLPGEVTREASALYIQYRSMITFDHSDSLQSYLYAYVPVEPVFDTERVELRDGTQLIAAGYFDHGKESTAAIINFYHPHYRKYSLGKYLMLLQMQRTIDLGKRYLYPGYLVEGNPAFDYKLFGCPEAVEVYCFITKEWLPYTSCLNIFDPEGIKKK